MLKYSTLNSSLACPPGTLESKLELNQDGNILILYGRHDGHLTSQLQLRFDPEIGLLSVLSFACSPVSSRVPFGFTGFLSSSQKHT